MVQKDSHAWQKHPGSQQCVCSSFRGETPRLLLPFAVTRLSKYLLWISALTSHFVLVKNVYPMVFHSLLYSCAHSALPEIRSDKEEDMVGHHPVLTLILQVHVISSSNLFTIHIHIYICIYNKLLQLCVVRFSVKLTVFKCSAFFFLCCFCPS